MQRAEKRLKSAELRLICSSWTLRCSAVVAGFPRAVDLQQSGALSATAAALKETISGQNIRCCHPAGRPAINSAGGGTEINAKIKLIISSHRSTVTH